MRKRIATTTKPAPPSSPALGKRASANTASAVEATTPATNQGSYRFRVVAPGGTLRGAAFTREQLVTGAVLPGGNGPFPFGGDDPDGRWEKLWRLADCLLEKGVLDRFLERYAADTGGDDPAKFLPWVEEVYDPVAFAEDFQEGRAGSFLVDRVLRRE